MAAIIINFTIKHVLLPFQCIVLNKDMKNNQNVCLLNDSHDKVIKDLPIEYGYRR